MVGFVREILRLRLRMTMGRETVRVGVGLCCRGAAQAWGENVIPACSRPHWRARRAGRDRLRPGSDTLRNSFGLASDVLTLLQDAV